MDLVDPRYIKRDGRFYYQNLIKLYSHRVHIEAQRTKKDGQIAHPQSFYVAGTSCSCLTFSNSTMNSTSGEATVILTPSGWFYGFASTMETSRSLFRVASRGAMELLNTSTITMNALPPAVVPKLCDAQAAEHKFSEVSSTASPL